MTDQPVSTALSRAVALRFDPNSIVVGATGIQLQVNPDATATARTIEGVGPVAANATAFGLGVGNSPYYEGLLGPDYFNSPNLFIQSGGGLVQGRADATARTEGRGDQTATALATNVGLANLSYLDRVGAPLLIGTSADPFSASARAGTGSVLGPAAGTTPTNTVNATARVRGLQGSGVISGEGPERPNGVALTDAQIAGAQTPSAPLNGPLVINGSGNTPLFDFTSTGGLATANLDLSRKAAATNTLGFYRVIATDGTVRRADGVLFRPGDSGYAAAALAPDNLVTELQNLSLPTNGTASRPLFVDETGYAAPFATLRSPGNEGVQVFGFNDASTFNNFLALSGNTVLLEDLNPPFPKSTEPDYNDLTTGLSQAVSQPLPILDFRNSDGPYQATLSLQRQSMYNAVLGYYRVRDVNGSIEAADGRILLPGAPDYNSEALRPANLVSELQDLKIPAGQKSVQIPVTIDENSLIIPFARITPVGDNAPAAFELFAYPSANQDAIAHLLSTGQLSFTIEDLLLSNPLRQLPREPDNNDLTVGFSPFTPVPGPIIAPVFSFYGQPNAVVEARAELFHGDSGKLLGTATADAKGIESYEIKAVPNGNGDGTATITGDAAARLVVSDALNADSDIAILNGSAIGIDASFIFGAPTLNTIVSGKGLATADVVSNAGIQLEQLKGIGIQNSLVFTNRGNDVVRGFGGFSGGSLPLAANAAADARDAAGIDGSGVYTGLGDDIIFGKILNEVEANTDANGDGLLEDSVFLDHSATDGGQGGFDGIRNSTADTGLGNDLIAGSSSGSAFEGAMGNDSIDLDRARNSSLWGGMDSDLLRVNGASENVSFWGSLGNDTLKAGDGSGNKLDGGLGIDLSEGGNGSDFFLLGDSAASLTASSSDQTNSALLSDGYWQSLSDAQKQAVWSSGQVRNANDSLIGGVDTINNFQAGGGGDVLEINSALASMTDELWRKQGAIFSVDNKGKLSVQEGSAGSNRIGVVVGSLADIQKMGISGSSTIAYATDTHQLLYDSDGDWSRGTVSMGTVNISGNGNLTKSNFAFGGTTGGGVGTPSTAAG